MMKLSKLCGEIHPTNGNACARPGRHDGQHAWKDPDGTIRRWGRDSGPATPHADRQAAGLRRLEVYLSPEAQEATDILKERLGSNRAAIEWAVTMAPLPPKK